MHIPGYGYGRVEDRGAEIKGNRIDLYFLSHRTALDWGRVQTRVRVWPPSQRETAIR
jgi:3D (Asp-Asp-Asp) domain-containing protein